MNQAQRDHRWTGIITISAGLLALFSLVVGLIGVGYDFEVFSDTSALIAVGATAAGYIRWSNWLNMLGSYLLLVPLALYLYQWLRADSPFAVRLFTVSGLFYLGLGAMGAAILATVWPLLIEAYATATTAQQEALVAQFRLATAIGEGGLQGVLQNICGTVWFLGIGNYLRTHRKVFGFVMMVLGLFQLANTVGNFLALEMLSLLGLTGTILVIPLWAIVMGLMLIRQPILTKIER